MWPRVVYCVPTSTWFAAIVAVFIFFYLNDMDQHFILLISLPGVVRSGTSILFASSCVGDCCCWTTFCL